MAIWATAVGFVLAAVLLSAGLEKARDRKLTAFALRALGLPQKGAGLLAGGLLWVEIGVGVSLVFRPDSAFTHAGVVGLACAFALAGVIALSRDEPIRCNCFGPAGRGVLGASQLVALVPWLGGVAILRVGAPAVPSLPQGALALAAIGLLLSSWQALRVTEAHREARGDRLTALEMVVWLR